MRRLSVNTTDSSTSVCLAQLRPYRQLMDSRALLSWVRPGGRSLGYIWQPVSQGCPNETRHCLSWIGSSSWTAWLLKMKALHSFETWQQITHRHGVMSKNTCALTYTTVRISHLAFSCNVPHICFANLSSTSVSICVFSTRFSRQYF
jgi:hypothetical protein